MSDWFLLRSKDRIFHYCAGVVYTEASEGQSMKEKATKTELSKWFYPVSVSKEGKLKCLACTAEGDRNETEIHNLG